MSLVLFQFRFVLFILISSRFSNSEVSQKHYRLVKNLSGLLRGPTIEELLVHCLSTTSQGLANSWFSSNLILLLSFDVGLIFSYLYLMPYATDGL